MVLLIKLSGHKHLTVFVSIFLSNKYKESISRVIEDMQQYWGPDSIRFSIGKSTSKMSVTNKIKHGIERTLNGETLIHLT